MSAYAPVCRLTHVLTFFVDRSLGGYLIPDTLRELGYRVECHAGHFGSDEQNDSEWLTLAGQRGWAVLSADD